MEERGEGKVRTLSSSAVYVARKMEQKKEEALPSFSVLLSRKVCGRKGAMEEGGRSTPTTTQRSVEVSAQVVVPCGQAFTDTLEFFTSKLGFRVELISPADDPRVAVIVGLGIRLRLERTDSASHPPALVLTYDDLDAANQLFGKPNCFSIIIIVCFLFN